MQCLKYKLIEKSTGNAVCYGDDNTTAFGGPWGAVDESGQPLFVWVENTPTAEELKTEAIKALNAEYEAYQQQLQSFYLAALMGNDTVTQRDIVAEREAVLAEYAASLAEITQ